jgi:hypothetical protein
MNKFNKIQAIKEAKEASQMSIEGVLKLARVHSLMHKVIGKTYQQEMVAEGIDEMPKDQAQVFRLIGGSDALQAVRFRKSLPAAYATLRYLAPLSVEFVEQAIKAKHIHAGMTREEARILNRMNRELKGQFKANYFEESKHLIAEAKDMTWRDEMMTGFLRASDTTSDNELVIGFLNNAIGSDANDHRSLGDAYKEVIRQVEWLSQQMTAKQAMEKMVKSASRKGAKEAAE